MVIIAATYLYGVPDKYKRSFFWFYQATIAEIVSGYHSDSNFWVLENDSERSQRQEFIRRPGQGFLSPSINYMRPSLSVGSAYGGFGNKKFYQSKSLTIDSVGDLSELWVFRTKPAFTIKSQPGFYEGQVFFPTGNSITSVAVDTGEVIWEFSVPPGAAERGFFVNETSRKIYFTSGYKLYCLAVYDGLPCAEMGNDGYVSLPRRLTTAPVEFNGRIYIGSADATLEYYELATGLNGFISLMPKAQPMRAGKLDSLYRGGRIWSAIALDVGRGYLYATTSNPEPVLVGVDRPGDNTFSSSVVAFDLSDHSIKWSFQDVSHDLWDFDIAAPPILATIPVAGVMHDVVVSATKSGKLFVLDPDTGDSVFDELFERAPVSLVSGEKTSIYQRSSSSPASFSNPFPDLAQVVSQLDRASTEALNLLDRIDSGFFRPPSPGRFVLTSALHGGVNWPGAAVDAEGNAYLAVNYDASLIGLQGHSRAGESSSPPDVVSEVCASCHNGIYQTDYRLLVGRFDKPLLRKIMVKGVRGMPPQDLTEGQLSDAVSFFQKRIDLDQSKEASNSWDLVRSPYKKLIGRDGYPLIEGPWGYLVKIKLSSGEVIWKRPMGLYDELIGSNMENWGTPNFGAPIVLSSGLILVTGTDDRSLWIFNSDTGDVVRRIKMEFNGSANPVLVSRECSDYIIVASTGGGTLSLYNDRVRTGNNIIGYQVKNDQCD